MGKKRGFRLLKYTDDFVTHPAGDVIFREGDDGKHMYVVKSGTIELHVAGIVVETVEAGDIMGEMAMLDCEKRSATAVALTEVQLVPIDNDKFQYLIRQTPYFAIEVMQIMAERLRHMNRQTVISKRTSR